MGLNSVGKVQQTAVIELRNPKTGKPIPGPNDRPQSVELYGPFSDVYKRALRAQQMQRIESGQGDLSPEMFEQEQVDLLIACIKDWNIALEEDALPFAAETARTVFAEHPWVLVQLQNAQMNAANFLA